MSGGKGKYMIFKRLTFGVTLVVLLITLFSRCNDPISFETDQGELVFSYDTITFDTVFTSIGSTTLSFTVRNPYDRTLVLSSVSLAGTPSFFRLNIDGEPSNKVSDYELAAHDSIYIFVEVTIDPNNQDNPVLIEDSVLFLVNGNQSSVLLQAYGQDVHIINASTIGTTTWSGKPYLIMDTVYVDTDQTLTIEKGTTLYFHNLAALVGLGNIMAEGTIDEPIVFRGDRLDEVYNGYKYDLFPGLWDGIYLVHCSKKSVFKNVVIKNSVWGLIAQGCDESQPLNLELYNTVIHNNSYNNLHAVNTNLSALNCQFTNSGYYNVFIAGGESRLLHCTMANYYNLVNKRGEFPCLWVSNYDQENDTTFYIYPTKKVEFENCIVDGSFDYEMIMRHAEGYDFSVLFKNSAIKMNDTLRYFYPESFENCYFNDTVKFLKLGIKNFDFSLDTLSKMRDLGDPSLISRYPELEFDLRGNSRSIDGKPDLGAYEFLLGQDKK